MILKNSPAFSGFSVNDLEAAKAFYGAKLGIAVVENAQGLVLKTTGSNGVFIYQKDNHLPATYTILNFPVDNIDEAVDKLSAMGVEFEHYDNMTDAKGVARGISRNRGPDIAWFKDPAGNILAVLQEA